MVGGGVQLLSHAHHNFMSTSLLPGIRKCLSSAPATPLFYPTFHPFWLFHPETDNAWSMVYVLKWTISLNCATFFFHHGFVSSQEEKKNQPHGLGMWVGHLDPEVESGCLSFPLAVLLAVHVPVLLSCPPTRVRHDTGKAWFHVTSRFVVGRCGGWTCGWVCGRGTGRVCVGVFFASLSWVWSPGCPL